MDEPVAGPQVGRGLGWAVAVVAVAAAIGWFGSSALARRAVAARLPAMPNLSARPSTVAHAVRAADAAARLEPSPATIGALGRIYHATQLAPQAVAAYAIAESLAPADDWTWTYHRALVLEERGAEGTREALEGVVARAPQTGHAWYRLGELHFKQGRLDEAATAYERAAAAPARAPYTPAGVAARDVVPLSAYATLALARVALDRGHADDARTRLRRVVDGHPTFGAARAMLRRLESAASDGDRVAAAGSFVPPADPVVDALVATSPDSDLLLKHAGIATRAGDTAWREFLVKRALAVNPDDPNVLMEASAAAQALGRPAEALEHLRRHQTLAPGDHHGLVQQGRVLIDLGRFAEAEAVLRQAIVVRDAAAEYNLGTVLDRLGRGDEARAHYTRALAIDPFHARAMNNLAIGLDRRGQAAAAAAWFERALAVAPDTAEFHVNYGAALLGQRRFDEAVRVLSDGVALDPRSADAQNNLGIALASLGDLPRARDAFTRALALAPGHASAHDNLARVTAAMR